MAINTSITPCVQRLKPVRGSFVLNTAGIPCDLHKCHLIHGMKTRTYLPHTIYPDIRDKSTDDFHPKISPRTTHSPFNIQNTMLEAVLLLVYWGARKKEASRGQKATRSLHSHTNQLGQVIRTDEPVASQVQLHRNMHPGMQLLAHPSLGSTAKRSSNTPPAMLHSYRWLGT